jgi:heme A synthase
MTLPEQVRRRGERGGSRFNLIVVVIVIALAAYSAYNYAPVAYNAYLYKDFMQETVNNAAYPPAKGNDWVTQQLRAAAKEYNLPEDADIHVQNESGRIAARVTWTRPVQLPGYVYEYNFDHTARSSGFIR